MMQDPIWPFVLAVIEVALFFALVATLTVLGVMSWTW